jgi:PTS system nitrogen regulatory IIA component
VIGALVSLETPIEFESLDDKPVDLIFVLLVPEESFSEHLETLATLAELFNQESFCNGLRQAQTSSDLYQFATEFAVA